jgi:hypothetical protein
MTIKFASYAAFSAADKQVARDVQAFRQMMSGASIKQDTAFKPTKSATAAKGQSARKGTGNK